MLRWWRGVGWGGVGWGGGCIITSWRPRPWYYVDKTCWGNLEDVVDATLMTWGAVGWVGLGGVLTSMHFLRALQRAESDAYLRIRKWMSLAGNVEVDGTYLRRFWIKGTNRHFASQIEKVKNKFRKKNNRKVKMPKSFQVHVMALGGVVRGEHQTYVALPTPVVSFPGERPPTENLHQVHECNIFKHIQKRGACVFSDGNMAWRSLCYKNNIRNQEVVHQVKEFTR